MRTVLHLLTSPADEFTAALLEIQKSQASSSDFRVDVVDLTEASQTDYDAILEQVFVADSVSVW